MPTPCRGEPLDRLRRRRGRARRRRSGRSSSRPRPASTGRPAVGEALRRAAARARDPRRAARRCGRARRGRPRRRCPPAASRRRRRASRAGPAPSARAEPAISAPSGQPSPFERQSVTVSNCEAIRAARDAERDRRVQQPRPVEVDGDAELARGRDDGVEPVERPDGARRRGCACPRPRRTVGGRLVVQLRAASNAVPHLLGRERARVAAERPQLQPGVTRRRRPAREDDVRAAPRRSARRRAGSGSRARSAFAIVAVGR